MIGIEAAAYGQSRGYVLCALSINKVGQIRVLNSPLVGIFQWLNQQNLWTSPRMDMGRSKNGVHPKIWAASL